MWEGRLCPCCPGKEHRGSRGGADPSTRGIPGNLLARMPGLWRAARGQWAQPGCPCGRAGPDTRAGRRPLPWWLCPRPQAPCPQLCYPGRQGTPAHLPAVAWSAGRSSLAPSPHKGLLCSVQLLSSLINELPLALQKQVGVGGQASRHLLLRPGVPFPPLVLGPGPEGRRDVPHPPQPPRA